MIKGLVLFLFLIIFSTGLFAQIPIQNYREEILKLKSESEKDAYWQSLYKTDQDTLLRLPTDNITAYDSLSTTLMIKTSLMFEIHGKEVYKKNNVVPILNFTHNYLSKANLIFWPIINQCVEIGGYINNFATGFPAYQLEAISNNFYQYSLSGQEEKYAKLVDKIEAFPKDPIIPKLVAAYQNQKELRTLNIKEVIGQWYVQPFKNLKEDFCFEILKLSDDNIYIKYGEYFQKLLLLDDGNRMKKFKIENEPFGWYYKLSSDNQLKLYNSNHENLIEYSQCN